MITEAELGGIIRANILSANVSLNVGIPCTIVSVDGGDFVTVQPSISKVVIDSSGNKIFQKTPSIGNVRTLNYSCGGFGMRIPLSSGCKGWLSFGDYDMDNWADGSSEAPYTDRTHDQNDCVFHPAFNSGSRNDHKCLELYSNKVVVKISDDGFDVTFKGRSLIGGINKAFASLGVPPPFPDWKPKC